MREHSSPISGLVQRLRNGVIHAAEVTSRRTHERPDSESPLAHSIRLGIFAVLVLGVLAYFAPVLERRWSELATAPIAVKFDNQRWVVVPPEAGSGKDCVQEIQLGAGCPGHPSFALAGISQSFNRADASHALRVREFGQRPFWVVYDVSPAESLAAANAGANHLFIGLINGAYQIYANGTLIRRSAAFPERALVSATLPLSQLSGSIRIAVRIENNTQSAFPDVFEATSFRGTGFIDSSTLDNMLSLRNFTDENRHWVLTFVYLLVSLFFFLLWTATPRKRELFFFSVYGVVLSLLSMRLAVTYYLAVPRYQWYQLELFLRASEAGAALAVGLAIARIRREVLGVLTIPVAATALYLWGTAHSGPEYLAGSTEFATRVVPGCYLVSALACLTQWLWVRNQLRSKRSHWLAPRGRRLLSFVLVFGALGLTYALQARWMSTPGTLASLHRYMPLIAFFFSAMVLFREFRDQSQQMDYTPVSKYHRLDPLPQYISGVILEIDLKKSEALYRAAAHETDQNLLVHPFVDAWMVISSAAGGEIISYQGDMIRALFETPSSNSVPPTVLRITKAVGQMAQVMDSIAMDLHSRTGIDVMALLGNQPAFRAGISFGGLRPTLLGQGRQKMAAWMNADESQLLLRSARLLDAEKTYVKSDPQLAGESRCTLVIDEETVSPDAMHAVHAWATESGALLRKSCQTYLEEKKSRPPQFTFVSWKRAASKSDSRLDQVA